MSAGKSKYIDKLLKQYEGCDWMECIKERHGELTFEPPIRTQYTDAHLALTHSVFQLWQLSVRVNSKELWEQTIGLIELTRDFLTKSKRQFPNFQPHMEQWDLLHDLAVMILHEGAEEEA